MGKDTDIQWCEHTASGVRGCAHATIDEAPSPGCDNCYAEGMSGRNPAQLGVWGEDGTRVLAKPAQWKNLDKWYAAAVKAGELRRVFCYSLGDVFESPKSLVNYAVCDEGRKLLFAAIDRLVPVTKPDGTKAGLIFMLLTKRPKNVKKMVPNHWLPFKTFGVERVWPWWAWVGTSIENQDAWDVRAQDLINIPATTRFISLEPLLGPVKLYDSDRSGHVSPIPFARNGHCLRCGLPWVSRDSRSLGFDTRNRFHRCPPGFETKNIHLAIIGGESGGAAKVRVCEADWIRDLLFQCEEAGIARFVKQLGAAASDPRNGIAGKKLVVAEEARGLITKRLVDDKGGDINEWASDLQVREMPTVAP